MTALRQLMLQVRSALDATQRSVMVFSRDVAHGMLEVSHNTFALVGLVVVALLIFGTGRADVRQAAETHLFGWLQARHDARRDPAALLAQELSEPTAVSRVTALDPQDLTRQQMAVAHWISRRYGVAQEPIGRLVKEAWYVGERTGIDPTLILAIMAVESGFNPFAQSPVGAQGLMQVMTKVHNDKYEAFGGNLAAFDPVTNLRVGAQVLKECISRAGSVEAGLRYYVGAANLPHDFGYAGKVLGEQSHLRMVADGRTVAFNARRVAPLPATPPAEPPTQPLEASPALPATENTAAAGQVALLN